MLEIIAFQLKTCRLSAPVFLDSDSYVIRTVCSFFLTAISKNFLLRILSGLRHVRNNTRILAASRNIPRLHCQTRLSRMMQSSPISEVSNADSIPETKSGTSFWSRLLCPRHRLSGHFLSFPVAPRFPAGPFTWERRPPWQSRMDGRAKRLRSFVYAFPLGWLAQVSAASFRERFQSPSKETATRKRSVSSNDVVELLSTSVETSRDEPALDCCKFIIVLHRLKEQWFIL